MDEDFINYTIAPILGILFFIFFFSGCVTNKEETEYELLHIEDYHAKKNIDIKDIIKKDTC